MTREEFYDKYLHLFVEEPESVNEPQKRTEKGDSPIFPLHLRASYISFALLNAVIFLFRYGIVDYVFLSRPVLYRRHFDPSSLSTVSVSAAFFEARDTVISTPLGASLLFIFLAHNLLALVLGLLDPIVGEAMRWVIFLLHLMWAFSAMLAMRSRIVVI